MAETVLVTGGNGYIAGWCIAELLKRGYTVRTTITDTTTSLKTIKVEVTPLLSTEEWAQGTVELSVQRSTFALGTYAGS